MKRFLSIILCTALILVFAGCAQTTGSREDGEGSQLIPVLVKELERIQAERAAEDNSTPPAATAPVAARP